jgi:hypothetical protein
MRQPIGKITERDISPSLLEMLQNKTNDNIFIYYDSVIVDKPTKIVDIPIRAFIKRIDILLVHKNGTFLKENYDYSFNNTFTRIICSDGTWNNIPGMKTKFEFVVIKNIKRYTSLSDLKLIDGTVGVDKLPNHIGKALIPPGGKKGAYLIKKSNTNNDFEWLDFTGVNIVLKTRTGGNLEDINVKIVDDFTSKEYMYIIKNNVIHISDLPVGKYTVYVFANKAFRPEFDSYKINVESNTPLQLDVNMVERDHDIQFIVNSDISISNPSVKITNLITNDVYTYQFEGTGKVISKIISLPNGVYKAEIDDSAGLGLKQLTSVKFELDYSHNITTINIPVTDSFREITISTKFMKIIDMDRPLSEFIPMYEEDYINVLNPHTLTKINDSKEYEVKFDIYNKNTGETTFETVTFTPAGGEKIIKLNIQNNVPYDIRVNVNGDFAILNKIIVIEPGTSHKTEFVTVQENANTITFSPEITSQGYFTNSNIHTRYYNIKITQLKLNNIVRSIVIENVKAGTIIKVKAGFDYRVEILNSYNMTATPSDIHTVGKINLTPEHPDILDPHYSTKFTCPYTPIVEYGFIVDPDNSDPYVSVKYIGDCEEFIPVKSINGRLDLGSWEHSIVLNSATPVILDNGVEVKTLDLNNQSAGYNNIDTGEDFKGDFMVRFEKMYYSFKEYLDGRIEFRLCTIKRDPSYHAYAFEDTTGTEKQYMYYGMYEASEDQNSVLRSLPNKKPVTNKSIQAMYSAINGKALGYALEDYSKNLYIKCILTLLSKSLDSQFVYGRGHTEGNLILSTGASDNRGVFYNSDDVVRTLYIENLWGNTERWLLGLMYYDRSFRYKQHGPYTSNPQDYLEAEVTVPISDPTVISNNIITKCTAGSFGILPQMTTGNLNYYNDMGYISPNFPIPTIGGSYTSGNRGGIWYMNVYYTWNEGHDKVSSRITFV